MADESNATCDLQRLHLRNIGATDNSPFMRMWRMSALLLLTCLALVSQAQAQTTIRVNAGGPSCTDSQGRLWTADYGYSGGTPVAFNHPIDRTGDPTLFLTERRGVSSYSFSVPNGNYRLRLYFAENTFSSAGARVFSVGVEDEGWLHDFEIYRYVGSHTALVMEGTMPVTDGQLNIVFTPGVDEPSISAIEIIEVLPDTQAPTTPTGLNATAVSVSRIELSWAAATDNLGVDSYSVERCTGAGCSYFNLVVAGPEGTTLSDTNLAASTTYRYRIRATDVAGNVSSYTSIVTASTTSGGTVIRVRGADSAYTDSAGNSWIANIGSINGNEGDWGNISIAGTSDPALYRVENYGDGMQYGFNVPNGIYQVRLHFSENDATAFVGSRVFDVAIEGATVFDNLDVYAQAGASRTTPTAAPSR